MSRKPGQIVEVDCGTHVSNWMQPERRFRVIRVDIDKKEQPWRMTIRCICADHGAPARQLTEEER